MARLRRPSRAAEAAVLMGRPARRDAILRGMRVGEEGVGVGVKWQQVCVFNIAPLSIG